MIDISKCDRAEVLCALFNASKQQGMGLLDLRGLGRMDVDIARDVLGKNDSPLNIDYLFGRVMKIREYEGKIDPALYDRDNGRGACLAAISHIAGVVECD